MRKSVRKVFPRTFQSYVFIHGRVALSRRRRMWRVFESSSRLGSGDTPPILGRWVSTGLSGKHKLRLVHRHPFAIHCFDFFPHGPALNINCHYWTDVCFWAKCLKYRLLQSTPVRDVQEFFWKKGTLKTERKSSKMDENQNISTETEIVQNSSLRLILLQFPLAITRLKGPGKSAL